MVTEQLPGFAAVILAGGGGRRMGGAVKPALSVGGRSLLARVLGSASGADPTVVVGPDHLADLLPAGVQLTSEQPAGGGPVAGVAAALAYAGLGTQPAGAAITTVRAHGRHGIMVALLAADLPFLTEGDVRLLRRRLTGTLDAAVLVDDTGRPQWLGAVWWLSSLVARLAAVGEPAGRGMRELVLGARVSHVAAGAATRPPPWFDCDTAADLRRAEQWSRAEQHTRAEQRQGSEPDSRTGPPTGQAGQEQP